MGEVRRPGTYPWFEGMSLKDLILVAGGLRESAQTTEAELSRMDPAVEAGGDLLAEVRPVRLDGAGAVAEADTFRLRNHDHAFVRRRPGWEPQRNVVVRGEVLYPGVYTLAHRQERLSSVIARAGGLLDSAYPSGFRLFRPEEGVGNVGLDLAAALARPGGANDIVLEAGDEIVVPPRRMSVRVEGEVGFPTSVIYEDGKGIGYYVDRAGGYTAEADKGRTKVIYPNGTSAKVRRFWWDPGVEEGSLIMVPPRSPSAGVDWGKVIVGTTSVLASLATIYLVVDTTGN